MKRKRATYSAATMRRCRELREVGWTIPKIQDLLVKEGLGCPSHSTIGYWCDPKRYEKHKTRSRNTERRRIAAATDYRWPGHATRTPEFRLGRVRALRAAGLSVESIAQVMTHDFPDLPMTAFQVQTVLDGSVPFAIRRLAA